MFKALDTLRFDVDAVGTADVWFGAVEFSARGRPARRHPRFLDLDAPWITTIHRSKHALDLVVTWIWEAEDLLTPRGEKGEPCPTVFRTKVSDLTYEDALAILRAARDEVFESACLHGRQII